MINGGKQYYHFGDINIPNSIYHGELVRVRCSHMIESTNLKCKNYTEIGLNLCRVHLTKDKKLRIKYSNVAGLGLFAHDPSKGATSVIFHKRDYDDRRATTREKSIICQYNGEDINHTEYVRRYGALNPQYTIIKTGSMSDRPNVMYEDASLQRGVGSLVNHTDISSRVNAHIVKYQNKMVIEASKDIKNNKEILVDYGNSYVFNSPNIISVTNHNKKKF